MDNWLGLDVGTSSLKAIVVRSDGTVVARATVEHPSSSDGRRHEQRGADYLAGLSVVLADVADLSIAGIGIVGQTPSLVLVDGDGEPVEPVVTWRDTRGVEESRDLVAALGDSRELVGVGSAFSVGQLPAHLAWVARHRPEALARARWVAQPKDLLGGHLTGQWGSDPWSQKGLCNVRTTASIPAVFDHVGADPRLLPLRRPAWERRGTVAGAVAQRYGVATGTPVAVGWTDALGAMLAVGAVVRPTRFTLTGTSDIVGASSSTDASSAEGLFTVPAACSPTSIHYGPTQSSGATLDWLARLTGRGTGELCDLAAPSPDGRALFLPFLRGERAPLWSTRLRGAMAGVAESAGPAEVAHAVLMGVACSGAAVLAAAEPHTDAPPTVHLAGGAVDHPAWIDARLRALASPLALHHEPSAAALGAAMLARTAGDGASLSLVQREMEGDTTFHQPTDRHVEEAANWHRLYEVDVSSALARAELDPLAR